MKEVLVVIAVAEVIGVTIGIFNTIMSLHYTKKAERRDIAAYKASKVQLDALQYTCTNLEARLHKLEEKKEVKENAELKRDKEDLIFVRDQRAKCMCEDKEKLTQAREIIRRLMDIINHDLKCFDTIAGLDVKQKAEQFLKDTTDIREASTLDGDWVVDEH